MHLSVLFKPPLHFIEITQVDVQVLQQLESASDQQVLHIPFILQDQVHVLVFVCLADKSPPSVNQTVLLRIYFVYFRNSSRARMGDVW